MSKETVLSVAASIFLINLCGFYLRAASIQENTVRYTAMQIKNTVSPFFS